MAFRPHFHLCLTGLEHLALRHQKRCTLALPSFCVGCRRLPFHSGSRSPVRFWVPALRCFALLLGLHPALCGRGLPGHRLLPGRALLIIFYDLGDFGRHLRLPGLRCALDYIVDYLDLLWLWTPTWRCSSSAAGGCFLDYLDKLWRDLLCEGHLWRRDRQQGVLSDGRG